MTVAELYARSEDRLGAFLAQMVRDRWLAEDLLQETFHDVLRARVDLATLENVDAWLFAIARNRALAALRRRRRFSRALLRLSGTQPPIVEEVDLSAVRDLLDRHLSPDERSLVVLRYVHGFDSSELAAICGRSAAAVRQQLSRACAKLLEAARDEGWRWENGWTLPS